MIVKRMKHTSKHCCDKKWTAKWPYIANAVFRIVQNHGEKRYFCRIEGGRSPQSPRPPFVSAPGCRKSLAIVMYWCLKEYIENVLQSKLLILLW